MSPTEQEIDAFIRRIRTIRRTAYVVLCCVLFAIGLAIGIALPRTDPPTYTREITARVFMVERIVDGDTFVVEYDGEPTKVRIVDIDTPERGEPGYAESAAALRGMIEGRAVSLHFTDQGKRDRFGRLLCVVRIDGMDVGHEMLKRGFAKRWQP